MPLFSPRRLLLLVVVFSLIAGMLPMTALAQAGEHPTHCARTDFACGEREGKYWGHKDGLAWGSRDCYSPSRERRSHQRGSAVQALLNSDEYNRGWNAVYSPTFDHYWEIAYKVEGCELPASTGTTTGPTTGTTTGTSTTTLPL
jgi:hypothetical protein